MDHLAGGMYPGIGTAGTVHPHRVIGDLGQGLLHHFLHTARMFLVLPAAEIGAIVFNTQG